MFEYVRDQINNKNLSNWKYLKLWKTKLKIKICGTKLKKGAFVRDWNGVFVVFHCNSKVAMFNWGQYMVKLRWSYILGFYQARVKIISKINKIIELHRQQGAPVVVGNGVLGRLLEKESLPDDAVADFIINLLFAGNETTAKTMLFAVYFLTHCPRAFKQLLVLPIWEIIANINPSMFLEF